MNNDLTYKKVNKIPNFFTETRNYLVPEAASFYVPIGTSLQIQTYNI